MNDKVDTSARKPGRRRQRRADSHTLDPRHPSLYLNRELSQIEFNQRVLEQAKDPSTPLLERLRFLCISTSNLDEFFEIRVASVRQQLAFGGPIAADGRSPAALLHEIRQRALGLVEDQYHTWNEVLTPALEAEGIRFLRRNQWSPEQRKWLYEHFQKELLPVLSPLGLDPAHPFPRILNKSLNLAILLRGRDAFGREGGMAIVRAPRSLPRIFRLPSTLTESPYEFVFLASLLHAFVDDLFPGLEVRGAYQFRVTRDSELEVDEADVENLARALTGELHERPFASAVRLEVADNCPKDVAKYLIRCFDLTDQDLYRCGGPVNLSRLLEVCDQVKRPDLRYPPFKPRIQPRLLPSDLFEVIGRGDVLLHHPFDSFSSVVELLRQAVLDPSVLAIKQTLYRTGKNSVLVGLLIDAARAGKDVTVVVELRARFDEEANITLANRMQEAGVQVVYGVVGYKTHAKMMLIVRRERNGLRRYVHLGTGNYHASTALAYTDIGLLTAHPEVTEDVHRLFMQLSGLGKVVDLKRLLHSPFTMHMGLLERVERETRNATAGQTGRIIAKVNALNEPEMIRALYRASQAGVEIDLIVRGTCGLRPGVAGVSDRIRVRSIVGRFLEHSRVYYFWNNGAPECWCSSADWLERNLLRRVEVAFPILDPQLLARVVAEELDNYLADNTQAWSLQSEGGYQRIERGEAEPHAAQTALLERLCK